MRFPVFTRRANPRVDPPILRKSKNYVHDQVALGHACWVDSADWTKGIIAFGTMYFGERYPDVIPDDPMKLPPREVPGCYFQPPQSDQWRLAHRMVVLPPKMVWMQP